MSHSASQGNRCTCGKSVGVNWDTANGHALDCPRGGFVEVSESGILSALAFNQAGIKHDLGKPRVDLLINGCPKSLELISQVLTFGAKKYADHNWQKVPDGELRYKAALMRHMLASASGSKLDEESGLPHLAHMACCALFLLELELRKDA